MPRKDQLPADLEHLAFRNAIELTHVRWDSDLTVLVKALSRYVTPLQPGAADRDNIERRTQTPAPQAQVRRRLAAGIHTDGRTPSFNEASAVQDAHISASRT